MSGADRMVVVQVHLGETREEAIERFRGPHDERNRFLGAQRPIGGYLDEEGKPFGFGRLPTLEESIGQHGWFVGTPEQVRDGLLQDITTYGIEQLAVEIVFAGMSKSLIGGADRGLRDGGAPGPGARDVRGGRRQIIVRLARPCSQRSSPRP